ncbi:MAG: sporulation protein YqfD [Clostridia bacterium]|nr:sporulation protein YqfD [Clostridia bacterium]
MYGFIRLITGYIKLHLSGENVLQAVGEMAEEGFVLSRFTPVEDGYTAVYSVFGADALIKRFNSLGVDVRINGKGGLPFRCIGYMHRGGLWIGLVLALLIVFSSTRVLWDVRPECDGEFDKAAVIADLKKLGVFSGAPLYDINVYEAEQRFLIENSLYSDIAINIQGTVATVKLRLRTDAEHKTEDVSPCDIVAKEAGVIHKITSTKGEPAVAKGNTVAEGDILINGLVTGKHGGEYLYHAAGSVQAMVYREHTVIIPLKTTEKKYTGNTETKTLFTVLGKNIPLYREERTSYTYADVIAHTETVKLAGMVLPAGKQTLTYKEYKLVPVEISVDAAKEKALASFNAYLERAVDGEVQNTQTDCIYSKELNAVVLSGRAEVITEIGIPKAISPNESR